MLPSCYKTLGLEPGASVEDIKLAYRRLAAFYHPDRNPGNRHAQEMFRLVVDAYRHLSESAEPLAAFASSSSSKQTRLPVQTPPRLCRRRRRGTPSDRRFHWQLPEDYIGTHIQCEV